MYPIKNYGGKYIDRLNIDAVKALDKADMENENEVILYDKDSTTVFQITSVKKAKERINKERGL